MPSLSIEQIHRRAVVTGATTVVLTLACWSSVPLFIRHFADRNIDLWTSNGWRYGFSALLWLPVVIWGAARSRLPRGIWTAALVPGAVNAIGQICFAWAFYKIDPALTTFGLRTQIIFVAVGACLLFPAERRMVASPRYIVGAALVLVGSTAIFFLGDSPPRFDQLLGIVLSVASGLFFAMYGLSVRKFLHGMHPLLSFAVISQYTAVIMVTLMLLLGTRFGLTVLDQAVLSRGQVALLLLSGIIGIAIGHVLYYMSIARLGIAVSSGVLQLQPFGVAVAQQALGYGVPLTIGQWSAGLLSLAGALLMLSVQWMSGRRPPPPSRERDDIEAQETERVPALAGGD